MKTFYVEERLMCLEIIQDIVYAKNATHYDEIHKKLESTNINTVIDYFNKNWHGIITEWVIYFQSKFMTLGIIVLYVNTIRFGFSYVLVMLLLYVIGNRTNNRFESIRYYVNIMIHTYFIL